MARRTAKAKVKCPYCNKANVSLSIAVRDGGGVTGTLNTHKGMFVDPKSGESIACNGSGKTIPNRDIPPMNKWT